MTETVGTINFGPLGATQVPSMGTTASENEALRSIFRRCVDIIAFHNGDDSEKLEAIRATMLSANLGTDHD